MKRTPAWRWSAILTAAVVMIGGRAYAQSLQPLSFGIRWGNPLAISADGSTVVGTLMIDGAPSGGGFSWSMSDGLRIFPEALGIKGVSATGETLLGEILLPNNSRALAKWLPGGQMVQLDPFGDGSPAALPSGFGNVLDARGVHFTGVGSQGSFYSDGQNTTIIPRPFEYPIVATAISADGFTLVGATAKRVQLPCPWGSNCTCDEPDSPGCDGSSGQAFRWMFGEIELFATSGAAVSVPEVYGVTGDGSMLVGAHTDITGPSSIGPTRAMRWGKDAGEFPNPFPVLPGSNMMKAYAVSAEGKTVGGGYAGVDPEKAWIWTPETGVMDLGAFLSAKGIDVTGWGFAHVSGISMDGMVIVGPGYFNGQRTGFVVDLRKDTDGDGLYDDWETNGIPYMLAGRVERYRLPAANPLRKDIYVEIDAVSGQAIWVDSLDRVIAAFDQAPVPTPPGCLPGIALHAEVDDMFDAPGNFTMNRGWEEFHAYKEMFFGTSQERQDIFWVIAGEPYMKLAKAKAYRYCLFIRSLPDGVIGRAEIEYDQPAYGPRKGTNDFMIALGNYTTPPGRTIQDMQAAAFMHELGHTLGLYHGGGDALQNFNPNHFSVMNYMWAGTRYFGPLAPTPTLYLNYSDHELLTLQEDQLFENVWIGGGLDMQVPIVVRASITESPCGDPPTNHGACFRTNEQNVLYTCVNYVPFKGGVDWNNDHILSHKPVCADPNGLWSRSPHETLVSVNEWNLLAYNFRDSTYFADLAMPTGDTACPTVSVVEFLESIPPPPPPPLCPGAVPTAGAPTPAEASSCGDAEAVFTVEFDGVAPFRLQWRWRDTSQNPPVWVDIADGAMAHGTTFSGFDNDRLRVMHADRRDLHADIVELSCRVTDLCNQSVDSPVCRLFVGGPIAEQASPLAVGTCPGGTATFSVNASTVTGPLQYQWFISQSQLTTLGDGRMPFGTHVQGAHGPTLTLSNVSPYDFSPTFVTVQCQVSDACGETTLYFDFSPTMRITRHPSLTNLPCAGAAQATFRAAAMGPSLSYQWLRNGAELANGGKISGAHSPTLTIAAPSASDSAFYSCRITSPCDTQTTREAALYVGPPTLRDNPPVFPPVCEGGNAWLGVHPLGTQNSMSVRWMRNGVDLSDGDRFFGSGTTQLFITSVDPSDFTSTFGVRLQNPCGTFVSQSAMLAGPTPVTIVSQPQNRRLCSAGAATLSVRGNQAGLFYSWLIENPFVPDEWWYLLPDGSLPFGLGGCGQYSGGYTQDLTVAVAGLPSCPESYRFKCELGIACNWTFSEPARVVLGGGADFDCDGDVDGEDLAVFMTCAAGPALPYATGCTLTPDGSGHSAADFDRDGDIDSDDFGVFQRCFSGTHVPPAPSCMQ